MAPLAGGQVDELLPGMWRVVAPNPSFMTGAGTNSYLLGGPARPAGADGPAGQRPPLPGAVVAVDPGPDVPSHLERLLEVAPGPVRYVLVTHHHRDHASGASSLAALTGATVLAHGGRGTFHVDGELRDGDAVNVPGWHLGVLETPGHASDHLCFVAVPAGSPPPKPPGWTRPAAAPAPHSPPPAAGAPVLLSGDLVLGGTTVVIPPPDGDLRRYLDSLERIAALDPPAGAIAPGHGDVIGDPAGAVAGYLAHRREREAQVMAVLEARRRAFVEEIVDAIYTSRPGALHDAAAKSVWAHLRKLASEGRVGTADADDPAGPWWLEGGSSRRPPPPAG
ncbi:MAG TPA: MBL fold metallo-hydrolase [Acidimicrobiales bacterium]|nr:MBL fold metallo-hydrolase [Acidimicrobiales bacterium]